MDKAANFKKSKTKKETEEEKKKKKIKRKIELANYQISGKLRSAKWIEWVYNERWSIFDVDRTKREKRERRKKIKPEKIEEKQTKQDRKLGGPTELVGIYM